MANRIDGTDSDDRLYGTGSRDIFFGYEHDDDLFGRGGNDSFHGGEGADFYDGGDGIDTVIFSSYGTQGVRVELYHRIANDEYGNTEFLWNIENVYGTNFRDSLTGDQKSNSLLGFNGDDSLKGMGGDDDLFAMDGDDFLNGGEGDDYMNGGDGIDTASYSTAQGGINVDLAEKRAFNDGYGDTDKLIRIENVNGSGHNDIVKGDSEDNVLKGLLGSDILEGRGGDDLIDGGGGIDAASFEDATGAVVADLAAGVANGLYHPANIGFDQLVRIENLIGSRHGDRLRGDSSDNELFGLAGGDMLEGFDGDDYLSGHEGFDTLVGGRGNDVLRGGAHLDYFVFKGNDFDHDLIKDFSSSDWLRLEGVRHVNGRTIRDFGDIDTNRNGWLDAGDTNAFIMNGDLHVRFYNDAMIAFENVYSIHNSDIGIFA